MAYNRRNILLRIIDIQNIYKENSKNWEDGPGFLSDRHIYNTLIYPKYKISKACFYEYLRTPAEKQLKELEAKKKEQLTLIFE